MILHWAAIPLESVFDGYDSMKCNWVETDYKGVKMLVEPLGDGTGKIVRLLSPNPYDYLDPSFAPGSVVAIYQAK